MNNISISFAITVKDETEEVLRLLKSLESYVTETDEVVILFDQKNGKRQLHKQLRDFTPNYSYSYNTDRFNNDFGEWKNKLTSLCTKDYIFQIDADEYPCYYLLENLKHLLHENKGIDVFLVPRVNTVEGLTKDHIEKWNWKVNEKGWINFPDYQWRIYKNNDSIKWINRVHEQLIGFKTFTNFPGYEQLSLFHPKKIHRQERQNNFYSTILRS